MRAGPVRWAAASAAALLLGGCASVAPSPGSSTPTTGVTATTSAVTFTVASTTSLPPSTTSSTTTSSTTTEPPPDATGGLAAHLEQAVQEDAFSGVVLVARGEGILWMVSAGLADRAAGIPNHPDTRFNLMSMSKMITAVGVLQLLEQGLVALDGTISDYLPDYPNPEVAARVTVEHLLTHTSGLGDVFTEEFGADPHAYRTNADYLPLFVDEPLHAVPGEQFIYSNAGYVVLGLIIEEVSGLSYDEYVLLHVFEPSGMYDTGTHDIEVTSADIAIGYTTQDIDGNETGVLGPNTPLMPGRGFAAGGFHSTVGDLHRFSSALFSHVLLSPASIDLLITGRVQIREQAMYAFGFFDRIQAGQRVVGHGGGAPGGCGSLSIYPDTGHTVVVLSNSDYDCMVVLDYLRTNPPH